MSLIALTIAGAAGAWHVSRQRQFQFYEPEEKDPWAPTVGQRMELSTGTYGDVHQINHLLGIPGFIVAERLDVDLTGVPCRWLILRNGGAYKTYDLTTQFIL